MKRKFLLGLAGMVAVAIATISITLNANALPLEDLNHEKQDLGGGSDDKKTTCYGDREPGNDMSEAVICLNPGCLHIAKWRGIGKKGSC